jgi:hypothetical protein
MQRGVAPSFCALPAGVVERVFAFLADDARDLCASACVCTAWRAALLNPQLWRSLVFAARTTRGAITNARLARLVARSAGQLERLDLSGAALVTNAGLAPLALAAAPRLARLCLTGCDSLTAEGITFALSRCHPDEQLVAALRSNDAAAAARACLALAALLGWEDGADDEAAGFLIDSGAIAATLAALCTHAESAHALGLRILENGSSALTDLLGLADDESVADALDAGALQAAVAALQAHPLNAAVQQACLQAMASLVQPEDDGGPAVDAAILQAAVRALRTHAHDAGVTTARAPHSSCSTRTRYAVRALTPLARWWLPWRYTRTRRRCRLWQRGFSISSV